MNMLPLLEDLHCNKDRSRLSRFFVRDILVRYAARLLQDIDH